MSELEFLMQVSSIALLFFILGFSCAVNYAESLYTSNLPKILMKVFWGLAAATLVGGYIYQIFEYHIKTIGG